MSNKSQLQTNNTKYASLIQTLRGKAVGGGSSGGAETCTVTLMGHSPTNSSQIVYYSDGGPDFKSVPFPNMMAGSTDITVSVNSLIFSANMNPNPAGDITNISIGDIGIVGSSLFFVFGDCVLMGM